MLTQLTLCFGLSFVTLEAPSKNRRPLSDIQGVLMSQGSAKKILSSLTERRNETPKESVKSKPSLSNNSHSLDSSLNGFNVKAPIKIC